MSFRLATLMDDAVVLWLLVMSMPLAILALGTPLAFLIRLVLEILKRG